MLKKKLILTIEGNIGAGKSFLLSSLKDKLKSDNTILFAPEPVEQFSRAFLNGQYYNPLKSYYEDPDKFAFSTQMWILECYRKQLYDLSKISTERNIIIMDRGIYSSTIFTRLAHQQHYINDFEKDFLLQATQDIISDYFGKHWFDKYGADKLYYLDTPLHICEDRIAKRSRLEEKDMKGTSNILHGLNELYNNHLKAYEENCGRNQIEVFFHENINEIIKNFLMFLHKFET